MHQRNNTDYKEAAHTHTQTGSDWCMHGLWVVCISQSLLLSCIMCSTSKDENLTFQICKASIKNRYHWASFIKLGTQKLFSKKSIYKSLKIKDCILLNFICINIHLHKPLIMCSTLYNGVMSSCHLVYHLNWSIYESSVLLYSWLERKRSIANL